MACVAASDRREQHPNELLTFPCEGVSVTDADLVILGGGSGGYACAFRAAELGLSVILAFIFTRSAFKVKTRGERDAAIEDAEAVEP